MNHHQRHLPLGLSLIVLVVTPVVFALFNFGANSEYFILSKSVLKPIDQFSVQQSADVNFIISLKQKTLEDVSVQYSTLDGTALKNEDYAPVSGDVIIKKGQLSALIKVKTLTKKYSSTIKSFQLILKTKKPDLVNFDILKANINPIVKLAQYKQMAFGEGHVCAINLEDQVVCWGQNQFGQLGDGTNLNSQVPVLVKNLKNVQKISLGEQHSCAILQDQRVKCWGLNSFGQLGLGHTQNINTAQVVLKDILFLASGPNQNCVIALNKKTFCWGLNDHAQLGFKSDFKKSFVFLKPTENSVLAGLNSLVMNQNHACAVTHDHKLKCWGDNSMGQLGLTNAKSAVEPTQVAYLQDVDSVSIGFLHTCVLTRDKKVKCFGQNADGQVGVKNIKSTATPVIVENLTDVKKLASAAFHNCVILNSGLVKCWGYNKSAQLGQSHFVNSALPVTVPFISNKSSAVDLVLSYSQSVIIDQNYFVKNWGGGFSNFEPAVSFKYFGSSEALVATQKNLSLGIGQKSATLMAVDAFKNDILARHTDEFTKIVVGSSHSCAITQNATVKCWGKNSNGQLGKAHLQFAETPVMVAHLSHVTDIVVGHLHTCALSDKKVKCWGANAFGQLGDGTTAQRFWPKEVLKLDKIKSLTAAHNFTCAVDEKNILKCWGQNFAGGFGDQVEDQKASFTNLPKVPFALQDIDSVVSGGSHVCALTMAKNVLCWGGNRSGQLGNKEASALSSTPVKVSDLENVKSLSLGYAHACALLLDNQVKCWGSNSSGQLGLGNLEPSSKATVVAGLGQVKALALGHFFSCAQIFDGTVRCWGDNSQGQFANTSKLDSLKPIPAFMHHKIEKLACADYKCYSIWSAKSVKFSGSQAIVYAPDDLYVAANSENLKTVSDVLKLASGKENQSEEN